MFANTSMLFLSLVGPTEKVEFYGHPIVYIAASVYGHPHVSNSSLLIVIDKVEQLRCRIPLSLS